MADEIGTQEAFINHMAIAIYLADHPGADIAQLNDALEGNEGHSKRLAKVLRGRYLTRAEKIVQFFDLSLYAHTGEDGENYMRVEGGWL